MMALGSSTNLGDMPPPQGAVKRLLHLISTKALLPAVSAHSPFPRFCYSGGGFGRWAGAACRSRESPLTEAGEMHQKAFSRN